MKPKSRREFVAEAKKLRIEGLNAREIAAKLHLSVSSVTELLYLADHHFEKFGGATPYRADRRRPAARAGG